MDGDSSKLFFYINDISPILHAPRGPKARKPIRLEASEVSNWLKHISESDTKDMHSYKKGLNKQGVEQQKILNLVEENVSSEISDDDGLMTAIESDELEEKSCEEEDLYLTSKSQNRSRTASPQREACISSTYFKSSKKSPQKEKFESSSTEQKKYRLFSLVNIMGIIAIAVIIYYLILIRNGTKAIESQTKFTNGRHSMFKSIEEVKTKFYKQDSYIWDDIISGINEIQIRNPKVPSIILLFANETHTMNCLALALAHLSSNVLGGDSPLNLNPEDFGDDPGEIIDAMKNISTKKAVIIRDVLNINAEAIQALHNLCDKINPLIREVIYIITMQTKNYDSSQGKMAFVEKQLLHKLSKSIDKDILMALITRITDGAIISVQSQPNLRYC